MLVDVFLGEANDGHAELAEAGLREQGIVGTFFRSCNGPETLARIRQGSRHETNSNGVPPLILLDVGLPGLSGIDVLRELKSDPCLCRSPVVMMTARSNAEQAAECRSLGCDLYVDKWKVFLGLPCFAKRLRVLAGRCVAEDAVQEF